VLSQPKLIRTFSVEQIALALLLVVGMYFPSSIDGEHSISAVAVAYAILVGLLGCLIYKKGINRSTLGLVSLPIVIVLVVGTFIEFIRGPVDIDWGLFVKFSALALLLTLNIRTSRPGPLVNCTFVAVNVMNIACGIAVLIGNEWVTEFIPNYYWMSDSTLVPLMMKLHKPVLTFGTHSLAGLFTYLYFWVNWENYRLRRIRGALLFALSYFFLLLALASFTSLSFAALAIGQMGAWLWKRSRTSFAVVGLCVIAIVPVSIYAFADEVSAITELPQLAESALLNSDHNGPLSRFGTDGTLRLAMTYLYEHPFSPIGLTRSASAMEVESTTHFFVGDSGPLEYVLRGSVPLLFLIYFGLYRFLRHNLEQFSHWTTLFMVIMVFETGFSALDSSRTFFLLPFFLVYLNQTVTQRSSQSPHGVAFPERQAFSV